MADSEKTTPDPNTLKLEKEIGRSEILFSIARQSDSNEVFVGSSDAKVFQFDPLAEKPEPQELAGGHSSYITGLVLPRPEQLVSGAWDRKLVWWDLEKRQPVRSVDAHQKWIRRVVLTPDRKTIVTVADDMICRLWDAETGELRQELAGHAPQTPHHFPSMLFAAGVSADGTLLATADKVGHIVVWELATGKKLAELDAPEMYTWDPKARIHSIGGIRSVAFSHDNRLLAVGGINQIGNIDHLGSLARVEIFDWKQGERTHEFKGDTYKGLVERLEFHPDNAWLLAAGGDHGGFIKFFDLENQKIIKQDKAPMHVHDLVVNETFDTIYAAGHGKVVIWKMT